VHRARATLQAGSLVPNRALLHLRVGSNRVGDEGCAALAAGLREQVL
jgi:hypothetical protein